MKARKLYYTQFIHLYKSRSHIYIQKAICNLMNDYQGPSPRASVSISSSIVELSPQYVNNSVGVLSRDKSASRKKPLVAARGDEAGITH